MPELIGLDFETYGAVDLPTHGLMRYVNDPSFKPLIASVTKDEWGSVSRKRFDFVTHGGRDVRALKQIIDTGVTIVAHNAIFEKMVLGAMGIFVPSDRFIDSAVVARAAGAGGKLEAAAPQLLNIDKLEEGKDLMRLFSIRSKAQVEAGVQAFNADLVRKHAAEWDKYQHYCDIDSELGLKIVLQYLSWLTPEERQYMAVTMDMNETGWCVDIPTVEEMQRRYLENVEAGLHDFVVKHDAKDLNLNSLKQLKEWCADRGIKANSFAEKPVERLLERLRTKLDTITMRDPKWAGYVEVIHLLETKQLLGGSSLKKLQVILDTAKADTWHPGRHRLWDQYLHCGAGQSLRTTGRSAQMQNLKRLTIVQNMDELSDDAVIWDNGKLAENIRQVFTATDPYGFLIVGDLKSVESRGLAWLAAAWWKVDAFRAGKDMYKVMAEQIFNRPYDTIGDKSPERQTGKVGELSCGYQAGSGAVQSFAAGMGITLTEAEAAKLVFDWRGANPEILAFWAVLDEMLHRVVVDGGSMTHALPDNYRLTLSQLQSPASMLKQSSKVVSVMVEVTRPDGTPLLKRFFHGCYVRGRNICYHRPSERKTGDLWKNNFVDPKTKQRRFYEIYGGKLAGILTQSFCRELFMEVLLKVHTWVRDTHGQLQLVGQFHDEIVLDWKPGALGLDEAEVTLDRHMSTCSVLSFPLAADVKHDYRYTK